MSNHIEQCRTPQEFRRRVAPAGIARMITRYADLIERFAELIGSELARDVKLASFDRHGIVWLSYDGGHEPPPAVAERVAQVIPRALDGVAVSRVAWRRWSPRTVSRPRS